MVMLWVRMVLLFPFFLKKKQEGTLPITDINMTRFNISLQGGVEMVMYALENAWGGEIYVPKIPSYRITDIAKAIAPKAEIKVIGIRPGEKVHEEMITSSDSYLTYDLGKYFVILPSTTKWDLQNFLSKNNATKVEEGFSYNSLNNTEWLTIDQLRLLIKEHVDPNFNHE
jgi:UDP-N-acetylglucosamine 4,6-dehydratase